LHGHATYCRSDFQCDNFFREESERPTVASLRRFRKSQGNHFRFLFAVEDFLPRRTFTFLAVQRNLKSLGHELFPHVFDTLPRTEKGGDFFIFPVWAIGVRFEQNIRASNLGGCSFQFCDNGKKDLTLLVTQANNIFFFHDATSHVR
jgi:hypothetical protein